MLHESVASRRVKVQTHNQRVLAMLMTMYEAQTTNSLSLIPPAVSRPRPCPVLFSSIVDDCEIRHELCRVNIHVQRILPPPTMENIALKIQDLGDLELAILLSLVAEQHCIITTKHKLVDELAKELQLVRSACRTPWSRRLY